MSDLNRIFIGEISQQISRVKILVGKVSPLSPVVDTPMSKCLRYMCGCVTSILSDRVSETGPRRRRHRTDTESRRRRPGPRQNPDGMIV